MSKEKTYKCGAPMKLCEETTHFHDFFQSVGRYKCDKCSRIKLGGSKEGDKYKKSVCTKSNKIATFG